ncbi:arginine/ornithine antiporter ArcD [Cutibacterium acnes JCM 18916]|nr:arginine/ornithine antiporter ArcD [Cutibacterium acnes JCM 18916]
MSSNDAIEARHRLRVPSAFTILFCTDGASCCLYLVYSGGELLKDELRRWL